MGISARHGQGNIQIIQQCYCIGDYFSHYYKTQDDPYLETREQEERFVAQIVDAVEAAMEKALPVFLSGCITGLSTKGTEKKPDEVP